MSDLRSIMLEKAKSGKEKVGQGKHFGSTKSPSQRGPGSIASSSHGSMPEVQALEVRKVPTLKGPDSSQVGTSSLSEYMARRRGSNSNYAGSTTGSVRSVETTQSMVRMSEELAMNRQELTALKKDNKEIKDLLTQLLAAQRSGSQGQK